MSEVAINIDPKNVFRALSAEKAVEHLVNEYEHGSLALNLARHLKTNEGVRFAAIFVSNLQREQKQELVEQLRKTGWFQSMLEKTATNMGPATLCDTDEQTINGLRWRVVHTGEDYSNAKAREREGWRLPKLEEVCALSSSPRKQLFSRKSAREIHYYLWLAEGGTGSVVANDAGAVLMFDPDSKGPSGVRIGRSTGSGTTVLVKEVTP